MTRKDSRRDAATGLARAIREISDGGSELIRFAFKVLRGENPEATVADQRWAVEYLSDRGFGRAPIEIQVETSHSLEVDLDALTDQQLSQLRDAMRRALGDPSDAPPLLTDVTVKAFTIEGDDEEADEVDGDD